MAVTRWTRLAAVWLLGMGLLIAGIAVYGVVSSRWACDVPPDLSGYRLACDLAWIFAAVAAVIAGLHVVTAVSVWRGHVRGAVAGAVLAALGLLGSTSFLEDERWWVVPPVAAGYLATSLVLGHAIVHRRDRGRHPTPLT
jgi:hypothetical protein